MLNTQIMPCTDTSSKSQPTSQLYRPVVCRSWLTDFICVNWYLIDRFGHVTCLTWSMQVIDEDNLAIVAIATGLLQLVYFLITWSCRVHKLSDFAAGSNFFFIAFLSLCLGQVRHCRDCCMRNSILKTIFDMFQTFYWRQIVMTLLVLVWGCRLSGYLLYRMYHVGEDLRISEDTTLKQFAAFWSFQVCRINEKYCLAQCDLGCILNSARGSLLRQIFRSFGKHI